MSKRCENWSLENKQCKFNYTPMPFGFNRKDIIPQCDGFKTLAQCCWFKGYHLDIAGNDSLLRKFRNRVRNEEINCGETPCELCWKYKKCLKEAQKKSYYDKRAEKELAIQEELWKKSQE